jgi:hypothetical protein
MALLPVSLPFLQFTTLLARKQHTCRCSQHPLCSYVKVWAASARSLLVARSREEAWLQCKRRSGTLRLRQWGYRLMQLNQRSGTSRLRHWSPWLLQRLAQRNHHQIMLHIKLAQRTDQIMLHVMLIECDRKNTRSIF